MDRLLLLVFGLTCTLWGLLWGLRRWGLRRHGARTTGTVVEIAKSGLVIPTLTPVVEFTTEAGDTVRIRGSTGQRSSSPYRVGDPLEVIYSRRHPRNALIGNFEQSWLGPASLCLFGLIALGALASGRIPPREDGPATPVAVAVLVLFGATFAVIAATEIRSWRVTRPFREGTLTESDLLAKIDRAAGLHPEGREVLLRARTAVVTLKDDAVNGALDSFLDRTLAARDREEALKGIRDLAKGLDRIGGNRGPLRDGP